MCKISAVIRQFITICCCKSTFQKTKNKNFNPLTHLLFHTHKKAIYWHYHLEHQVGGDRSILCDFRVKIQHFRQENCHWKKPLSLSPYRISVRLLATLRSSTYRGKSAWKMRFTRFAYHNWYVLQFMFNF